MYAVEFTFNWSAILRIHSAAYYRTKECTTDTFWNCLERKGCSKILKIPKKYLQKYLFFPNATTLQFRIFDSKKNVSFTCFEIVTSLQEKRSMMKSFG